VDEDRKEEKGVGKEEVEEEEKGGEDPADSAFLSPCEDVCVCARGTRCGGASGPRCCCDPAGTAVLFAAVCGTAWEVGYNCEEGEEKEEEKEEEEEEEERACDVGKKYGMYGKNEGRKG
jgi:hypothetical protein